MTVYMVVLCLSVGLAATAEANKRTGHESTVLPRPTGVVGILVILLLSGVAALRWNVGTDYRTYDALFRSYAEEVPQSLTIWGEPGLRIVAWVANEVSGDSAVMFAIAAVITVGLTMWTIWRWSPAVAFSVGIYILSGSWHGSFNGIRQYLACAVLFAGHRYIIDKRLLKWIGVVIIGVLFHVSAIIGLLIYLVPRRRISLGFQLVAMVTGIAGLFGVGWTLEVLADYTDSPERWESSYAVEQVHPLRVAFAFVPVVLHWLLPVRPLLEKHKGADFYVNMVIISAVALLAASGSAMLARFVIYPKVFVCIGLAYITALSNGKDRLLLRGVLLAVFGVFMFIEVSGTPNLNDFHWIFERR